MARVARAAALLLLPVATMAQAAPDRPFVAPQRDVDVLYAVPVPAGPGDAGSAPGTTLSQRMRFAVGPERQRVDPPGDGTYMVTDYAARRMLVVQPGRHVATALSMPGAAPAPPGVRASGDYRRLDEARVAGIGCTDWSTRDSTGHDSTICLTGDGVMLRAMQQGRVLVQATRVSYGRQDPAIFAVPSGYRLEAAPTAP